MNVVIDGITYIPAPEQPAPSTMTAEEKEVLHRAISGDGFDYAFTHYSDFQTTARNCVHDPRFHQLRVAFIHARKALETYLEENGALP